MESGVAIRHAFHEACIIHVIFDVIPKLVGETTPHHSGSLSRKMIHFASQLRHRGKNARPLHRFVDGSFSGWLGEEHEARDHR
jgi:hypothetical protein